MASTSNWSVVGKPKKGKGPNSPLSKSQKKQFVDNMPRIAQSDPVQESSTIYDAFVQKEQQRYEKRQQEKFADKIEAGKEPNGKGISDGVAKKKTHKPKKTEQVPRKQPFEDAIKLITEEDLRSVLLQSKGHFPEKPDLWLKDLVTYMNMKLENCIETDKYLQKDNTDFPASSLKKNCTKVITPVLAECTLATLDNVLFFCVNTMLDEAQNGAATFGFRIFIQLLVRSNPEAMLTRIQQYHDLVRSTQNRPERCLMVLWSLSQAGFTSLKAGLRVWLDVMFPLLSTKALGGFCMQYLEIILGLHSKHLGKGAGEIKMKEYFTLLDMTYGSGALSGDIQARLQALYPQIEMLSQGLDKKASNLRNFFPFYLLRATTEGSKLKDEVLRCLVDCLAEDQQCFVLWCQVYMKHLRQSSILLGHLSQNWESLRSRLDGKVMQQTLMTILRTNEESTRGKHSEEVMAITSLCEDFLKKLTKPRFPWRWVVFFLVSLVTGVVVYDMLMSPKIKDSKIVQFLELYGILGVAQNLWEGVNNFSCTVGCWCRRNIPVFFGQVQATLSPVLFQVWEGVLSLEEATRENRQAAISTVYAWAPDMWDQLGVYLHMCWDFILEYTYWIQGHIATFYTLVYHWVDTNIINGDFSSQNIRQNLFWSAAKVQEITTSTFTWCKQLIAGSS
ncbi:transmembrane protein 214-B-like [Dreissena polymorpha]|uniref:transmembrane protein 214-B-like n=1 Tax=Dreissena polymorpha TaxID=45954 RepID=UPI002264FFFA|nr:transmembrane protein 214-B-like [Dreissena polymorpha]